MSKQKGFETRKLARQISRDSCPLRRSFVERPEGDNTPTPMARLLRTRDNAGGRGGGVRLALLLSIIWVCAREPYTSRRVAPFWAELLGREDPRGEGARVIRDCLHELSHRGFIELIDGGQSNEIRLMNESNPTTEQSSPEPYKPPYGADAYLSIPRTFWLEGVAGGLSGAGVAMYLVALSLTKPHSGDFFISGTFFDQRFGISRSSRKRGLAELVDWGVLTVRRVEEPDPETHRMMRRNIYTVADRFRQTAARPNPSLQEEEGGLTVQQIEKLQQAGLLRLFLGKRQR